MSFGRFRNHDQTYPTTVDTTDILSSPLRNSSTTVMTRTYAESCRLDGEQDDDYKGTCKHTQYTAHEDNL